MKFPNYHIITVKWLGMTNTRPAMVKLTSERFKESITIPFTNEPGESLPEIETAEKWLTENNFDIIGHGQGKDCYHIITDTFEPLKKIRQIK
jgi:hypothetical protein